MLENYIPWNLMPEGIFAFRVLNGPLKSWEWVLEVLGSSPVYGICSKFYKRRKIMKEIKVQCSRLYALAAFQLHELNSSTNKVSLYSHRKDL